jgi:hypothetical protein
MVIQKALELQSAKLWKWEYVPGVMDSPVILGSKTRNEIDAEFDREQ